jgi:hypothetical protein
MVVSWFGREEVKTGECVCGETQDLGHEETRIFNFLFFF